MKTITITIPEELDAAAAAEARRRGVSKSELIRTGIRSVLPAEAASGEPSLWVALAGFGGDTVMAPPGSIDEVVYDS